MIESVVRGNRAKRLYFIGCPSEKDIRATLRAYAPSRARRVCEIVFICLFLAGISSYWWLIDTSSTAQVGAYVGIVSATAVAFIWGNFRYYAGTSRLDDRSRIVRPDDVSYKLLKESWVAVSTDLRSEEFHMMVDRLSRRYNYATMEQFAITKGVVDRYFVFTREVDLAYRAYPVQPDVLPGDLRVEAERIVAEIKQVDREYQKLTSEHHTHEEKISQMRHDQRNTVLEFQSNFALRRFQAAPDYEQATQEN